MNETSAFDRFLESELRQLLDPVTATPAPPLEGRRPARTAFVTVAVPPLEAVAGAEPVVIAVPVSRPA